MEKKKILYKFVNASYLKYGLFPLSPESHNNTVITLQKRATSIRLISSSSYISHTNPLLIQHKLLNMENLFKLIYCSCYPTIFYNHILINTEIIEHEPARVIWKNYRHPPLTNGIK